MTEKTSVELLAEEYLARLRRGERADAKEYQDRYPDLAREIGEFFPTLKLVETFKPNSQDRPRERHAELPHLERLGDFRLVREIGRGGMGVVYVAEQESLGRTVALKVLPTGALADARQKKRFLQEARSAARLHHTNIVPIFGVSEQDGLHYYVMQWIRGLSLDEVLLELKRQRSRSVPADPPGFALSLELSGPALAKSLISGRFPQTAIADASDQSDEPGSEQEVTSVSQSSRPALASTLADRNAMTFALPGQVPSGSDSQQGSAYWRSVARIGIQVADALQYAHDQGVVHRDVKPANLLLDTQGTVWVTDFGLAKSEDQEDLTRAGDMVGTLRYMAPEQFEKQADPRSDLYALGLTLYELLALRPAFDQTDRRRLVQQVATGTPERLRRIDPRIPADLETIIHKAMDRDPSHRYQTAGELGEDLKRYLSDLPIHARRISPLARFTRWSRRNPAVASLLAILVLLVVVSPALAIYFTQLVLQAKQAQQEAQHRLYQNKRSEATASRFSGRPGQHFTTLEALAAAVDLGRELDLDTQDVDAMRDEAIAALALPDLHVEKSWPLSEPGRTSLIHFDANLEHYTSWDNDALSIRRVVDNQELRRLPISASCEKARFSPDGRLIGVIDPLAEGDSVQVWDWRRGVLIYSMRKKAMMFASGFSPDSRLLAVGHDDASVTVHDLVKGQQTASFEVPSNPIMLRFHPTEPQLAVNCQTANRTQLWDLEPLRLTRTLDHPSDVFSLCWGPQGRFLAVVVDSDIHLWDFATDAVEPLRILKGHTFVASEIQFHPHGRLMYSHCWREGKTRVWDPFRGQQLLSCEGFLSRFSSDARRFAFRTANRVGIWSVAAGDAYIWPPSYGYRAPSAAFCHYSSDGRLLASAGGEGIHVWDTSSWQLLAQLSHKRTHCVLFEDAGDSLLAAHHEGLVRYPLHREGPSLHLGAPALLPLPERTYAYRIGCSADGRTLLVDLFMQPNFKSTGKAMLFSHAHPAGRILQGDRELRFPAVSPDGRWGALGNWHGSGVTIWDVAKGSQVHRLRANGSAVVAFSPDGQWLVTADLSELTFWQVGTWQKVRTLSRSALDAAVAFSPDSRMLAATTTGSEVRLIETDSGRCLAILSANDNPAYVRWLAFSPDGRQLAVCCASEGLRVWDLRRLREGLRRVNLDWETLTSSR